MVESRNPRVRKTFKESSNIFQFAPCFCVGSIVDELPLREAFWNERYTVQRGDLTDLPDDSDEKSLFEFSPTDLLPSQLEMLDLFQMRTCIRTLCPVENFIIPYPRNERNEILPWGCFLDFEAVPIAMQPTQTLLSYLESRGLSP